MKIEIDISPDEVRQLFGLPDVSGLQNMYIERIQQWFEQQQHDTETAQQWMNAMIQGGRQSYEAYQEFLRNFTGMANTSRN